MQEAKLENREHGLLASGEGWYVLNACDGEWKRNASFGDWFSFEGDVRFPEFGLNIHVLQPGMPACMYHRESAQEGFLVLSGTCLAIVEGEERELRQWDYLHCPAGTNHVLVGAGEGPCAVLMIGARHEKMSFTYPVEPVAAKYGASAAAETEDPREAYAGIEPSAPVASAWPELR